jgi:hypothetical protein
VAATGDLVEVSKTGTLHADWTAVPAGVVVGSVLIYDGAGWVLLNQQPQAATESASGVVELATAAEVTAGTDATRAVHPAGLKVELDKKASLASPALTGVPTAPTAAVGTNTTQIATTAFVAAATPADATTTKKGVVQLADAGAITAGTAGRVVDAAQLDAAKAVYASSAETLAGTITNKSVTPKGAKDTYLPLNYSTLAALP